MSGDMSARPGIGESKQPIFSSVPPFATQDEIGVMFDKKHSARTHYHLRNLHNNRFEPQSTQMQYKPRVSRNFGRKQHFKFGEASGGSTSNCLIYGNKNQEFSLDMSGITAKPPLKRHHDVTNDSFLYGKNDNIHHGFVHKHTSFSSLEEPTSAEIKKKLRDTKETEADFQRFQQQKEQFARMKVEEKKKDLEMLKNYKQPWGRPGGGAPKQNDNYRSKEVYKLTGLQEQVLPLGRPGAGAPLRTDSGSLKANLKGDPEIRFQKRTRDQIHGIIEPQNQKLDKTNPLVTELDILAHDTRQHRRVIKRDADLSSTVYNPFGKPGAGAPLRDIYGKTKTTRSNNLLNTVHELDNNGKIQLGTMCVGRGGGGAPIRNGDGCVITTKRQTLVKATDSVLIKCDNDQNLSGFHPWGKCGAGAPLKDEQGNIVTTRPRVDKSPIEKDSFTEFIGAPRVNSDIVKQRFVQHDQDREKSRLYHAELDHHCQLEKRNRMNEKQKEREKSIEHAQTMTRIWGKPGQGAPREDHRRQKDEVEKLETKIEISIKTCTGDVHFNKRTGNSNALPKEKINNRIAESKQDGSWENPASQTGLEVVEGFKTDSFQNNKQYRLDAPFGTDLNKPTSVHKIALSESLKRKLISLQHSL